MKNNSLAAVIVVAVVVWAVAVLHDFAQDKPMVPVEEIRISEPSIPGNTAVTSGIILTGKVNVVRDEATYRVLEVGIVSDDGRVFRVLQDGRGKQLVRVLRSKIVRVTGEIREENEKPVLVVHDMMVIGSTKHLESASSGPDADTKHTTNTIPVNVVSPTNMPVSAEIQPSTNAGTTVESMPIPVASTNQAF